MTDSGYDAGYAQAIEDMQKFATSARRRRDFTASVARGEGVTISASDPIPVKLRAIREAKRITQAEVAEGMQAAGHDFYQATVYKLEAGRRRLLAEEVCDLAEVLEVEPSALI